MKRSEIITKVTTPEWQSFSAQDTATGYSIYESKDRFLAKNPAEKTLCSAGIMAIVIGLLVLVLPGSAPSGHSMMTRIALSALCMGMGTAVYFLASRAFRKVLHLDLATQTISMAHVSPKDKSLFGEIYRMDEIESLFVRRGVTKGSLAALHVRMAGKAVSQKLLHGAQDELEDLHLLLSRDIHSALDCTPRRVQRPAYRGLTVKTPRPEHRSTARKTYPVALPVGYQVPDPEEVENHDMHAGVVIPLMAARA